MSGQYLAAALMFFLTIGLTSMFCYPAIRISQKNNLIRFYWRGFWGFLVAISALAGAQAILIILGQNVERPASALLGGISMAFILFVIFAWGRLSLQALSHISKKPAEKIIDHRQGREG